MSTNDGGGAYSAAGNEGVAFVFQNVSSKTCDLDGYPKLAFSPSTYEGRSTTVSHNCCSEIFADVSPRVITVRPKATASFGLNFGDAYNQDHQIKRLCTTRTALVRLPVHPDPYGLQFRTSLQINFCFANFRFGVSSIQSGSKPEQQ
jgi:hypothetical protein